MVDRQIARRGITDRRILTAMGTVPRHRFVPASIRPRAYEDGPLPIGEEQTISQPYIVARMAELADIQPSAQLLEVGTGCGYAAAVFAELAREVVTVEIRPRLADDARRNLAAAGYDGVTVVTGTIADLDPDDEFDSIMVAAAGEEIPSAIEGLLAAGGRLVIPVGDRYVQYLWTIRNEGGRLTRRRHERVAFVPLVG